MVDLISSIPLLLVHLLHGGYDFYELFGRRLIVQLFHISQLVNSALLTLPISRHPLNFFCLGFSGSVGLNFFGSFGLIIFY